MVVVVAVIVVLAALVALRMRRGVSAVKRAQPQELPVTAEGRLWVLFRALPTSDKLTVAILVLAALLGTSLGLYALVLWFW